MSLSNASRLLLAFALLLTACSTAKPLLKPADTPPAPDTTVSILRATSAPTEAMTATLLASNRTVVPTNTLVPVPRSTVTAPSPTDTAVLAPTFPTARPSITITVTMINYRFDPAILRARTGETIRLELRNPDNIYHALAILAARFSILVRPGDAQMVDFVVDLPSGSYYLVCPVQEEGNHEELGMTGTLIVEAAP